MNKFGGRLKNLLRLDVLVNSNNNNDNDNDSDICCSMLVVIIP